MLVLATEALAQESYKCNISFELRGHNDSFVSLAYHMGDRQYIRDTISTDRSGHASYKSTEALERGLYMVVFPDNSLFEIIISDDQQFNISCSYSDNQLFCLNYLNHSI